MRCAAEPGPRFLTFLSNRSPALAAQRRALHRVRDTGFLLLTVATLLGVTAADRGFAQAPAFTPRDESPEDFPPGPGREVAFYACVACHNFKLVAAQGMSRARWDESLTFMTQRHNMPALEGEDRRIVLDYLEKTYPPRAPGRPGGWQNPFTPR
jgi:mono/diheme cytochrome c family protein